jgi:hypothetical protein
MWEYNLNIKYRTQKKEKEKKEVYYNTENTHPVCKKILLTTVYEKCKIEFFLSIECRIN